MNYTLFDPTTECWNWCKEQYFIYQNNLTVKTMLLPALALLIMFIVSLIFKYDTYILENTDIDIYNLEKACRYLINFAILLILGFFIWFVWLA